MPGMRTEDNLFLRNISIIDLDVKYANQEEAELCRVSINIFLNHLRSNI